MYVGQSIVELVVTTVVLTSRLTTMGGTLRGLGLASLACAVANALVTTVILLHTRPTTAPGTFRLFGAIKPTLPHTPRSTTSSTILFDGDLFVTAPENETFWMTSSGDLDDELDPYDSPYLRDRSPSSRVLDPGESSWWTEMQGFLRDGLNMVVRSALLQVLLLIRSKGTRTGLVSNTYTLAVSDFYISLIHSLTLDMFFGTSCYKLFGTVFGDI